MPAPPLIENDLVEYVQEQFRQFRFGFDRVDAAALHGLAELEQCILDGVFGAERRIGDVIPADELLGPLDDSLEPERHEMRDRLDLMIVHSAVEGDRRHA